MPKITLFKDVFDAKAQDNLDLEDFLHKIEDGHWQDLILPIRTERSAEKRKLLKQKLPNVTLSGIFNVRHDDGLITHSGVIGIDIDDVDPEEAKSLLCADPHVYAAFTSVSGRGLCLIIPIDGKLHRESFLEIQKYIYSRYGFAIDPTAVNPSRQRYVSFDPDVYINRAAKQFEVSPEVRKSEREVPKFVFTKEDFEFVLAQIEERFLDITEGYRTWLKLGFAIADQFGEGGRDYFHRVSKFHTSYNQKATDKQYTACVKAGRTGVKISTFFYLAKQAGLKIFTPKTKNVADIVKQMRDEDKSDDEIERYLKTQGLDDDHTKDVVDQINQGADVEDDSKKKSKNNVAIVERFMRQHYTFRRNKYTLRIEVNGREINDTIENSIYIHILRFHPKIPRDLIRAYIDSEVTDDYDPFKEFFNKHSVDYPEDQVEGSIKRLFDTIDTRADMGVSDDLFGTSESDVSTSHEFKHFFGRKWIIGLVAAVQGEAVPLMLVLTGMKQNTGKTEWFRRLLPDELHQYYAESKLDHEKDSEILMTKKLIIMDDEMGGKSKMESKRLKELTSASVFTVRAPYGRHAYDLKRLAVLCGTSNDHEILSDVTGNRRIIPIHVNAINHQAYNEIDKRAVLFEAYYAYLKGERHHLDRDTIVMLNEQTTGFEQVSVERESFQRYFRVPNAGESGEPFTNTDIRSLIEAKNGQRLNAQKLGMELKKIGIANKLVKKNGVVSRVYMLIRLVQD